MCDTYIPYQKFDSITVLRNVKKIWKKLFIL